MQLKQLLDDDDAVSPVIGVILMVAITVILAAVIGTFVLGLGDQVQDTAPNSNIEFDYNGAQELEITQTGGQGIEKTKLGVAVDGEMYAHTSTNEFNNKIYGASDSEWFTGSEKTSAGDSVLLVGGGVTGTNDAIELGTDGGGSNTDLSTVDEVRVVWRSGDQSSTIQTWNNN